MKIKDAPRFTKNDFLTTTKPYKFITECAETLLEEQQLVEIFRREALHCGVMNFVKMYSCYKQDCSLLKDEQQKDIKVVRSVSKSWFKDVKEIHETTSQEEAERLLSTGIWKLLIKLDSPVLYSLGRVVGEVGKTLTN